VRGREKWPGALFVVGRPTSPIFSRPARCCVERLGGSGAFLGQWRRLRRREVV